MFEKVFEMGMLFDFYGKLLSDTQYTVVELYYIHDLSLSEIAEDLKISRQGVHDALKRAENNLYSFEEKLGLVKKFENNKTKTRDILKYIDEISKKAIELNDCTIDENIENIRRTVLGILETS
ncbi:putative helix-turn-helix protein, YlxM/p13-like protein [Gottschalkia acidurici 9a]|uniref:UPF0122 protein Curi_c16250 n=1 Tax=Gottschalkia acidurici (strain ATCC 7906 / DSM 604 / BCRC 14475 / CIP 104303 / KCTC 5404 / NCIMB 10678 / 9a) TaxID=1128398 RepID=K0AXU8_GOTA9|nr:YlxM family DNA-binding protein [Gottschalkia acidurici]AFS78633.1 putative helix-turn-helix protein, YlxM/p13-like protein [Gottschalkia acidurici 9a]